MDDFFRAPTDWSLGTACPSWALWRCARSGHWVDVPTLNHQHWTEQPLPLLLESDAYCVSPTGLTGPCNGSHQSLQGWGLRWLLRTGRVGGDLVYGVKGSVQLNSRSCAQWLIKCALFTLCPWLFNQSSFIKVCTMLPTH